MSASHSAWGSAEALALVDVLAARRRAHSLPGHLYHDPGVFALETEHVWQRSGSSPATRANWPTPETSSP